MRTYIYSGGGGGGGSLELIIKILLASIINCKHLLLFEYTTVCFRAIIGLAISSNIDNNLNR